jgi:hypothetical protein
VYARIPGWCPGLVIASAAQYKLPPLDARRFIAGAVGIGTGRRTYRQSLDILRYQLIETLWVTACMLQGVVIKSCA